VSVIALLLEVLKLSKFQEPEYKLYAFSNMLFVVPVYLHNRIFTIGDNFVYTATKIKNIPEID
jgi:hypothetical protein